MAKVTHLGLLPPDDPSYSIGPVVGGKRIGRLPESGKTGSSVKPPKTPRPCFQGRPGTTAAAVAPYPRPCRGRRPRIGTGG